MKMNILGFLGVVAVFNSCSSPLVVKSDAVPTQEFYQSLTVIHDEEKATQSYRASFRNGSAWGDSIQLVDPAKVLVDGKALRAVDMQNLQVLKAVMPMPFLFLLNDGYYYIADGDGPGKEAYQYDVTYPNGTTNNFKITSFPSSRAIDLQAGAVIDTAQDFNVKIQRGIPNSDLHVTCVIYYDEKSNSDSSSHESYIMATMDGDTSTCTFKKIDFDRIGKGTIKAINTRSALSVKGDTFKGFTAFEIHSKRVPISK
jgi:hypothetical protein